MNIDQQTKSKNFNELIALKFQLFNSLFTSLPFYKIEKTGVLLSLFLMHCEETFESEKIKNPEQLVHDFFSKHTNALSHTEQLQLLFSFIKYVERQVVLFDALEDAAFPIVNDVQGNGTWKHLESAVLEKNKVEKLERQLKSFSLKLTLTAHPTQFYPGVVLGIINDLSTAIQKNNTNEINALLLQLGKTPFFKKEKPSPYSEAVNLIWYLENVFYTSIAGIVNNIKNISPDFVTDQNCKLIEMGFWPGGDRDGNPFVKSDTTLQVAEALKSSVLKSYYLDIRKLKRKLTFKNIDTKIEAIEKELYEIVFFKKENLAFTKSKFLDDLNLIKKILVEQHGSLFLSKLNSLITKVEIFGLHFASIDIRQESTMHENFYQELSDKNILSKPYKKSSLEEKIKLLETIPPTLNLAFDHPIHQDIYDSAYAIRSIQQSNGEAGCHRYVISQCNSVANILEVFYLFQLIGWKDCQVDVIPLFETITDLQNAPQILHQLFTHKNYQQHLQKRKFVQTVMLGFSDGTKDGGYFMANWRIFKAREELVQVAKQYDIDIVFFDGRGGPPARGGGKTHKFYASMGKNITTNQIQLTVQGQTISSNYGTTASAKYNIEQLLHAGIYGKLFNDKESTFTKDESELLEYVGRISHEKYAALKEKENFMTYLVEVSPLKFYSETNIGSRPAKRNQAKQLTLQDLRAIPYVGAWSQIKQNVTGYYGLGTALAQLKAENKFSSLQTIYQHSVFFRTLIDNCEMSMCKCYFPLTQYLSRNEAYQEVWHAIHNEFLLTQQMILELSGKKTLMEDNPVDRTSIQMRERIILPLLAIQQFGLMQLRKMEDDELSKENQKDIEQLITRCSFGIINSSRNSA